MSHCHRESTVKYTTTVSPIDAPCIACILLEGKSKQRNLLVSHGVKQAVHNPICKSPPLILIHGNYLIPVVGDFRQVKSLRKVHKIENILLEAASAKAY